MLIIRYSKIITLTAVSFYVTLVAFGNLTDYQTNFAFVKLVMSMESILPSSTICYRAVLNPIAYHIAYSIIIAFEVMISVTGWYGGYIMFCCRNASTEQFTHSKKWGIVALTLGVILWLAGFAAIGGEWFRMWMSTKTYHDVEASFRLFMMMIVVLIYLIIPEGDSTQSTNSK
ncbi:TPA: DUF2165 domain-containing protein [Salmonella enterica]|nr:DUF2165 domain-containing protein [Salmonella enterica]